MLFLIHENERITQANKVYQPEGYAERLNERDDRWISIDHPGLISSEECYVMNDKLCDRPLMNVQVSTTTIRANTSDASVLVGAPKDTKFVIRAMSTIVWEGILPDGELELSVPVPGLYYVSLDKWPYKTFTTMIEAR